MQHTLKKMEKPIVLTVCLLVILCFIFLLFKSGLISKLFFKNNNGLNEEVKTINFESSGYEANREGNIKVTKSAEWTGRNEATISFEIETLPIPKNTKSDIILIVDTSESLTPSRWNNYSKALKNVIKAKLTEGNCRIALIFFNSTAELATGFTNNFDILEQAIDNVEVKGATNYYEAYKEVDKLLKNYQVNSDTSLYTILTTDGYPTEGIGLDEIQYKALKEKFPDMAITILSYEVNFLTNYDMEKVSDYQYIATASTILETLSDAIKTNSYYNSFTINDMVNNKYFTLDNIKSVNVPFGEVSIEEKDGNQVLNWKVPNGKIKSGESVKFQYKLKLQDDYVDKKLYLPTSVNTVIDLSADKVDSLNVKSTLTPVLQSWYDVIYNTNAPEGCTITAPATVSYFPFTNVKISSGTLMCADYQFKGWENQKEGLTYINDENFIMPAQDVNMGAKWTALSIKKSMSGSLNQRVTLYEALKQQAVSDKGLQFKKPAVETNTNGLYLDSVRLNSIVYFRGNVQNNNVIFADFCWKIVRSVELGGLKIVYNGPVTNNTCVDTGEAPIIGKSILYDQESSKSLSSTGFFSGEQYISALNYLGSEYWYKYIDKTTSSHKSNWDKINTELYFSDSYEPYKDIGFKVAGNLEKKVADSSVVGKYTIFSEYDSYHSTNGYINYILNYDTAKKEITYIKFSLADYEEANGEDLFTYFYNKSQNVEWVYGNDVVYENGEYTLQDTISVKQYYYGDNINLLKDRYHYTCFSSSNKCADVNYVFRDNESIMEQSYIVLSNGEKIDDAYRKMVTSPDYTTSSEAYKILENWFEENMLDYEYMLLDDHWCNNRTVYDSDYSGWTKDGNSGRNIFFMEYMGNYSWNCPREHAFAVQETVGRIGKFKYPVGLLTMSEAVYAGMVRYDNYSEKNTENYLYSSEPYWLLTPAMFNNLYAKFTYVDKNALVNYDSTYVSYGIRPAVSLKTGVYAYDGDGTPLNPYRIEME